MTKDDVDDDDAFEQGDDDDALMNKVMMLMFVLKSFVDCRSDFERQRQNQIQPLTHLMIIICRIHVLNLN